MNTSKDSGNERAALTDQQIYDKFSFLEGVVNERRYRQIADTAIEIARAASTATATAQAPAGLTELHKELNQITWMGADEGWDRAIEAVRERITQLLAVAASSATATDGEAALHHQLIESTRPNPGTLDVRRFFMAVDSVRVARGLDWRQLKDVSGVTGVQWTRLAQMREPAKDVLRKMAEWANLYVEDFITLPVNATNPLTREEYEAEVAAKVASGESVGDPATVYDPVRVREKFADYQSQIDGLKEELAHARSVRTAADIPYRAASDCQYVGASEEVKNAWADGWNQCAQYAKARING